MSSPLMWALSIAIGLLFAIFGEPWLRRHLLAGCWVFGALAVFFAAAAGLNAAVDGWFWTALEATLAVAAGYATWKYRGRRKALREAP